MTCDELDHVGHHARSELQLAFRMTSGGGLIVRDQPLQPRDAREQGGKGRRRADGEHGEGVAVALRFEKALTQVQKVAARLYFARPPDVGGIDRRVLRRGRCRDSTTWSAMMAPNSRGKASSDCSNSPLASRSGVARPAACHSPTCSAHLSDRAPARRRRLPASMCARQPPRRRGRDHARVPAPTREARRRPAIADGRRKCRGGRAPGWTGDRAGVVIRPIVGELESLRASSNRQRRLLRRRHRPAQSARWPQEQSLAPSQRRRHDVRQRRKLGTAARRAWRAAAGRHPEVRARARAQHARGAAGAAGAPAHARACAARRPHRRQSAALDDGALQRRFSRCRRRSARVTRLPRPGLARERGAGVGVRRVRRRIGDTRGSRSRCWPVVRPVRASHLARATRGHSSGSGHRHHRIRRGHHRPGQLLHELDADFSRARRRGGARDDGRSGDPDREPLDRRAGDGGLHRRRRRVAHRRSHPPARGCRHREHAVAVSADARPLCLEHKEPLAPGNLPAHCELVGGELWTGEIARHDRLRLAYAVWSVLSRRLLGAD